MMKKPVISMVLVMVLSLSTGCQGDTVNVDMSPLPVAAVPPYLCDHIPLRAVELMTGVRDPLIRGRFDLVNSKGSGEGSCLAYSRDGDKLKVLHVNLSPDGYSGEVEEQLKDGALPLPEIVPGGVGFYFKDKNSRNNAAYAMLVRGKAELTIRLEKGVEGRDSAADVLALMKLIAPKLMTDAGAPSVKAASPSPEGS
ncbi:hypothetical protein [Streptosporangium saharense]|uniref:hypothetical protein n=1 Tax=Streptosporangium saharense TaxID=1706840 RepID=UPI003429092D